MTVPNRRRPLIGPLMIVVGVVHVAITPVLFPDSVASIVHAGVVNSIESEPDLGQLRGIAFWYATAGVGLIFTGWVITELEKRGGSTPPALPLILVGLGVWGIVFVPKSPFWVFIALAVVAALRHRRQHRADRSLADPNPSTPTP